MTAPCGALYSVGTACLTISCPIIVYVLAFAVNSRGCVSIVQLHFPQWPKDTVIFSWQALVIVYGWFALQLLLHCVLPGRSKHGMVEPDGKQWLYKLNGVVLVSAGARFIRFGHSQHKAHEATRIVHLGAHAAAAYTNDLEAHGVSEASFESLLTASALLDARNPSQKHNETANNAAAFQNFCVTYIAVFGLAFFTKLLDLGWAADHYLELLTASMIFSVALACALDAAAWGAEGPSIAHAATTDSPTFNFWMGRLLNPRFGRVDLKEFCELYPGLMGWMLLNLAMAHKQFTSSGQVTMPMVLVNIFQLVYVCDALWYEPSILTTVDITTEGFGFMLVFGDLTWVPFVYSIQARYLLYHFEVLSLPWIAFLFCLNFAAYIVFRGSNGQKDLFRTNPHDPRVAHLKTLPTERGTKLICSGWWGIARHINYTGDWLMSLAWCMTCGFGCCAPYFYALYFAILLVHRDMRDDHACRMKYGGDWSKYCKLVPYRLIPYVY